MRTAWFHPFAGIAGDMALGALLDAGADATAVEAACRRLGYDGWTLRHRRVDRAGLWGTHVQVDIADQHHHRRAADIIERIGGAGLPERATQRAVATFGRLAEVEGRLHGVDPADVQFHEVGAVDSIIDIVGTAVALELLAIDRLSSGPVALGVGTVTGAHGVLPNPAPAVTRLLEGVPVRGVDVPGELTTPTGAALLVALCDHFGAVPSMTVTASGYGAGTRNPPGRPNLLQVVIGDTDSPVVHQPHPDRPADGRIETVCSLETNVDDVSAETLGHLLHHLLDAGALDAWCTPVTMKKARPGAVLTVLCPLEDADGLRELVARETGTLGIRIRAQQRWVADRRTVHVDLDGCPIRVKVGPYGHKAEFEDVAAAARRLGRPLRDVARRAAELAGERLEPGPTP